MTTPRPHRSATTKENMTATSTGLIYVSRTAHRPRHGAPALAGRSGPGRTRRPPSRAELEAGIAGASAAVITLTERVDADLLAAAGTTAEGHRQRGRRVRQHRPGRGRRRRRDRHQHPRRPRPRHRRPHLRADPRRHPPHHRGRPAHPRPGNRGCGGHGCWSGSTSVPAPPSASSATAASAQAVARRAQAFDMTVIATARSRTPGTVEDGVTFVDTPTLLADSDVVSVHTPLTPRNPPPDRRRRAARHETHRIPDQHRPRRRRRRNRLDRRHFTPVRSAAPPWTCSKANPMSTRRCSTSPASSSLPTRPAPAKPPATPWASSPWTTRPPSSPESRR